jgi:CRP-like cAMP-binding protein
MELAKVLSQVELFDGLQPAELEQIAKICRERSYRAGEVVAQQGAAGDELFVIWEGLVEVVHSGSSQDSQPRTVVNLGQGQVFGEMALVDFGPRSATVRVVSDTAKLQAIRREDFLRVCDQHHRVGFVVMRNIAADLSFKLRHQNLLGR